MNQHLFCFSYNFCCHNNIFALFFYGDIYNGIKGIVHLLASQIHRLVRKYNIDMILDDLREFQNILYDLRCQNIKRVMTILSIYRKHAVECFILCFYFFPKGQSFHLPTLFLGENLYSRFTCFKRVKCGKNNHLSIKYR